jgi:hypothetical protein
MSESLSPFFSNRQEPTAIRLMRSLMNDPRYRLKLLSYRYASAHGNVSLESKVWREHLTEAFSCNAVHGIA